MARQTILLVDPDARSQRVLDVSLRKAGFTVHCANSVDAALALASGTPPDIVLTESRLDGDAEGGAKLTEKLREDPATREAIIVFLAANTSNEVKISAITAGADEFLGKPILFKDIVARLAALIERQERALLERRERPANFTGTLAGMGLLDLLQLAETGRKSCTLALKTDPHRSGGWVARAGAEAQVHFLDGRVIDAEVGPLRGPSAVYRLMLWEDADFELSFVPPVAETTVEVPMQGLILEGIRRLDEWDRLGPSAPDKRARLLLDLRALATHAADVPEEADAVLRLFDGKHTLLEILDGSPIDELATIQVVVRAVEDGILVEERSPRHAEATSRVSLDDWLSRRPSLAPPARLAPEDDLLAHLPSELGQVMIPSAQTLSQIFRAEDPLAPVPLETVRPEPITEDLGPSPRDPTESGIAARGRRNLRGAAYRSLRRPSTIAPRPADMASLSTGLTGSVSLPPRSEAAVAFTAPPAVPQAAPEAPTLPILAAPAAAPAPVPFAAPAPVPAPAPARVAPPAPAPVPAPAPAPVPAPPPVAAPPVAAPAPRAPTPPPRLQAPAPMPTTPPPSSSLEEDFSKLRPLRDDIEDDSSGRMVYWILGGLAVVAVLGLLLLPGSGRPPTPNPGTGAQAPSPSGRPAAAWPAIPDDRVAATATRTAAAPIQAAPSAQAVPSAPAPTPAASPAGAVTPAPDPVRPATPAPTPTAAAPVPAPAAAAPDAKLVEAQKLLRKEKWKDARGLVEPELAAPNDSAERHAVFAHALYGLGQGPKSTEEAKKALTMDAANARAHLVLGLLATDQNRLKDATQSFRRYLELEPNGDYASELRSFLKSRP